MFRRLSTATILAVSLVLTGCASIVNGSNQVLSVETRNSAGPVIGANCKLENPKGVYYVTTPGTVSVNRAYDELNVKCEKAQEQPGLASVKSNTKAMAFGNIIFGGVIGAAVDVGTGAAYDYPMLITVLMGQSTNAPANTGPANAVPANAVPVNAAVMPTAAANP